MEHKRTDHPSTGPKIYYEGKVIPDADLLPTLAGWPGGEQRAGHQRNIAEPTNSLRQPINNRKETKGERKDEIVFFFPVLRSRRAVEPKLFWDPEQK